MVSRAIHIITFVLVSAGAFCARADTLSCSQVVSGDISCTGALDGSDHLIEKAFTVPIAGPLSITIQTYGFGGGINAAGSVILAGGFDPLVALFSAAPESVLPDGGGNPIASIPGTTQFFPGCGPAGLVTIGADSVCGDSTLTVILAPGTYNLVLSDSGYIPFAVSPGPPLSSALSDGFADLTGGVFQTCTASDCISDSGNFAFDILGLPSASVPEPGSLVLFGSALLTVLYKRTSS